MPTTHKSVKTARNMPSFDVLEVFERPTLVGKLVVELIGAAGAGNGRCLVSDTLPRLGTLLNERWSIAGYILAKQQEKIHLIVKLVHLRTAEHHFISGPSMEVSAKARDDISAARNKPKPERYCRMLYERSRPDITEQQYRTRIASVLDWDGELIVEAETFTAKCR